MDVQNGLPQRFEQKTSIKKSYNSNRVFSYLALHSKRMSIEDSPRTFFFSHKSPFQTGSYSIACADFQLQGLRYPVVAVAVFCCKKSM